MLPTDTNKIYYQVVLVEGIGSYRGLPDAAPEAATTDQLLGISYGVNIGIEYLFGLRENIDHKVGIAHRLQVAFIFKLL